MKKNRKYIIIYLIVAIALIITQILVYKMAGKINLISFLLVNLILPSLIVIVANIALNDKNSNIKICFIHAVLLSILSLMIGMGSTQLLGDQKLPDLTTNQEENKEGGQNGVDQEILDELDRQARQKMIEEGLVDEDETITSEPYGTTDDTSESKEKLTGTWDIQVEKENPLSTITSIFLDILLSFAGGIIGVKVKKMARMKPNNLGA